MFYADICWNTIKTTITNVICRHLTFHYDNLISTKVIHSTIGHVSEDLQPRNITMLESDVTACKHLRDPMLETQYNNFASRSDERTLPRFIPWKHRFCALLWVQREWDVTYAQVQAQLWRRYEFFICLHSLFWKKRVLPIERRKETHWNRFAQDRNINPMQADRYKSIQSVPRLHCNQSWSLQCQNIHQNMNSAVVNHERCSYMCWTCSEWISKK